MSLKVFILFLLIMKTNAKNLFKSYGNCDVLSRDDSLHVYGQNCEQIPIEIGASNVTHLFINDTSIWTITTDSFNSFPKLLHLEITHSNLNTIDPYAFKNLTELKTLNLSNNQISDFHPGTFLGLEHLYALVLAKNNITQLKNITPALSPMNLPSLTKLDLMSNNLEILQHDDFELLNSSKLEELKLAYCNLTLIDAGSLLKLSNLRSLNIAYNNLSTDNLKELFRNLAGFPLQELDITSTSYPLYVLPQLSHLNLKKLVFGGTDFHIIKRNMFPLMSTLEDLSIVHANIMDVEDDALHNFPNLARLTLKPSMFKTIPRGILLPKLQYLDISGRTWKPQRILIPDYSFSQMNNLQTLDLSYDFVIHLKKGTFVGLSSLRHLKMKRCGIHSIEDETFQPLSNLTSLEISNNTILARKKLTDRIFKYLKSLKKLTFTEGGLSFNHPLATPFKELTSLEEINLTNSLVFRVSQNLFAGLDNIKHIHLSHNNIREWNEAIFSRFKNVSSLDLSHNLIVTATDEMLKDFDVLSDLDLSKNPFNCSCKLVPFLDWTNNTNVTVSGFFNRNNNNYLCDNPKNLLHSSLYQIHKSLKIECNSSPAFAVLVSLASVLILILLIVVIGYLYRLTSIRKLWFSSNSKTFVYDAFVSYSAHDSEWVFSHLVPQLENNTSEIKLCVYDRDFVAGRGISECILDGIQCSRRTILILSNNFLKSPWCRFETDLAHHTLIDEDREGLILIKLEELSEDLVNPQLNYLLKTKIYLAWSQELKAQEIFWKKLHKSLKTQKQKRNNNNNKIV